MANLSSYSCPKCGGILNVDADHDIYDCPFCGGHFDYVQFHKLDLLSQAEKDLLNGEFNAAKEKYTLLLNDGAKDFRTLQGYLFSIGNIHSADKLDDVTYLNRCYADGIIKLVSEDARYSKGEYAGYFGLFPELIKHSQKYEEAKAEYHRAYTYSKSAKSVDSEDPDSGYFVGIVVLSVLVSTIIAFNLMEKIKLWGFLAVLLIVIAEFIIHYLVSLPAQIRAQKRASSDNPVKVLDVKKRNRLSLDIQDEKDAYDNALKMFKELAPDKTSAIAAKKPADKDDDEPLCTKCGGKLTHNKAFKLYKCDYCGITYGYSAVFGTPRKKALADMKSGDFVSADKRFAHMLEIDPQDFDALRGRILCAGKWDNFPNICLTSYLKKFNLDNVFARINEARSNCYPEYKDYFNEINMLFKIVKAYSMNLMKQEMEPNNQQNKKEAQVITQRFNEQLRKVMDWDVRITSLTPEKREELRTADKSELASKAMAKRDFSSASQAYAIVLVDEPRNALAWRGLILSTGRWASVDEIKKSVLACSPDVDLLDQLLTQAKTNLQEEYGKYFSDFAETISYIEPYRTSEHLYNKLCAKEKLAQRDEDYETLRLIRSKIIQPESDRRHYKAMFERSVEKLIKEDAELFKSTT